MKKLLFSLSLMFITLRLFAATPDFSLVGFGAGTTGGAAGTTVTVSNLADLTTYATSASAYVIKISGTISGGSGVIIDVTSNKSFIGIGANAKLSCIQLHLKNASNVIIQNIIFSMIGSTLGSDADMICCETTSTNTAKNVWIDHCEFFNVIPTLPETAAKKDLYDGMIDIKKSYSNITISWNYIHDHWKCSLIGYTDADQYDRKITYHHNWFKNIKSRVASYRGGTGHFYNNYYDGLNDPNSPTSDGINCRENACIYTEGNYFLNYMNTVYCAIGDVTAAGYHRENASAPNTYDKSTVADSYTCTSFTPPYTYTLDPVANVPALVSTYSGVGKLNGVTTYTLSTATAGAGAGTVTLSPAGGVYAAGTVVTVTATPTSGTFTGWSGAATGTTNPTTITVNANATVTATFAAATTYTLSTATTGTGVGTVTLSPAGGTYPSGTVVTVTANATSGSFLGWSGAATGTTNPTTVTVTSNSTITANFGTPTYYALTTSVVGSGSIGLNPTGGNYVAGTVVTLTATPTTGFTFSGWSGAATGTTNPTTVTMSAAKTVTATFTAIPAGAKKVAYVTDAAGATYVNDTKILPALKADANLIVTELDGKISNDYSAYDVIVLSEIPSSTAAGLVEVETSGKPIVMMKVHAYKVATGAWGWTTTATAYGQDATTITNVVVSNTAHAIFKNVTFVNTNEVQMISAVAGAKGLTYMDPTLFNPISGGTASSIAYLKGATAAKSSILQIPAGTNINGTTLAKDLIQIGINGSSYANVTADGIQIVKNAIYYLAGVTTDVDEVKTTTFSCVPNPVESTTEILLPSDEAAVIAVYDLSGRKVKAFDAQSSKVTLDMADLNAGLYLITVTTNNQVMQQRIIKK